MLRRLLEEIVFRWSMRAHSGRPKGDVSHRAATFSTEKYDEWREHTLPELYENSFGWESLRGKRVLDFGCGHGAFTLHCAQHGARSVIGVDVSAESIARARSLPLPGDASVEFRVEEASDRISLPDGSVEVIVSLCSMEHVMEYEAIIREWARVLAPGGMVQVWWSVWWHPYGHHMHTMVPIPWAHVFLSDESLLRVCARIYDTPQFQPRHWHFDNNGVRKPNPYRGHTRFEDLNKLTIKTFDRVVAAAGLRQQRKTVVPFTGARFAALKRLLARSPWPDFFCACVEYELVKPLAG